MPPTDNRVRLFRFPLDAVATDFLLHHDGNPDTTPAPTHDGVLRQPDLPEDATVLYSRIDDAPLFRECERLRGYINTLRDVLTSNGLPVPEMSAPDHTLQTPALIVAVASAAWEPAAVGAEPDHDQPVQWRHFGWPDDGVA